MVQPIPPSPPPSNDGYCRQSITMDISETISHPQNSVGPGHSAYHHELPHFSSSSQEGDFVAQQSAQFLSPEAHDISLHAAYQVEHGVPNSYGPLPGESGYNVGSTGYVANPDNINHAKLQLPYTPEASPPTLSQGSDSISTRSSRNISKSPLRKPTAVKGARVVKSSKDSKKKKTCSVTCPKPLSELAKDHSDIQILDVGEFVTRSTEQRLSETSRNKEIGHIKRPMNAFMLYRKAYQELAKTQCRQNNHQIVSAYCGASWREESDKVTHQFNEWAKIERVNHHKAHPGYKFTPSKPRGRKQETDGESTVYSDGDDADWGSPRRLVQQTAQKQSTRQVSRLSETPSLTYEPFSEGIENTTMRPCQDMYGYGIPGPSPAISHRQLEQSPYGPRLHSSPPMNPVPIATSRHTSPNLDYPLQPIENDVDFWKGYYHGFTQAEDALTESPYSRRAIYNGIPNDLAFNDAETNWQYHMDTIYEPGPDMVEYGAPSAQDVYLHGTSDDWKVEEVDEASQFEHWINQTEQGFAHLYKMTWMSRAVTVTGLVLLAHACYSAQEHSAISSVSAQQTQSQQLSTISLPIDISIEALVATLVVVLGLVTGSPKLRPIKWNEWAGKIEREGEAGFRSGSGAVDKDYQGNPFAILETRPSFIDIRKQRREFGEWIKAGSK
ncbi:membrane magnesium transporter-domain-containing protein [Mariannaea sp. PMI_226]|nr:membrane magnesium transporter-domain-containing protein [Mariannaea sp. PMI_226]